jgi:hypothetical protein
LCLNGKRGEKRGKREKREGREKREVQCYEMHRGFHAKSSTFLKFTPWLWCNNYVE